MDQISVDWAALSMEAWKARDSAFIIGNTKVGAAVLTDDGRVFAGCNAEHRFRSHDVHAEVNAIGTMVAAGARGLVAVLVVAERDLFTPCGACMDWIFQFGNAGTLVAFQPARDSAPVIYTADQLMPFYPR